MVITGLAVPLPTTTNYINILPWKWIRKIKKGWEREIAVHIEQAISVAYSLEPALAVHLFTRFPSFPEGLLPGRPKGTAFWHSSTVKKWSKSAWNRRMQFGFDAWFMAARRNDEMNMPLPGNSSCWPDGEAGLPQYLSPIKSQRVWSSLTWPGSEREK